MARSKKSPYESTHDRDRRLGTAVIYARYGSHNQRDVSIEQQVEKCQAFAARDNLHIVEIYADRAISGKTDRRPNFQRMMKDAEKKKFQYVIAWKSNRMGRNMLEAMVNDDRLRDLGIRCLYVEEDFDNTAAGRFALRNMMNVNQFYSENMAEDVMRGMMDNASKCMVNGPIPYGYKRGSDGRFEIDPETAKVVREIFERVYDGELLVDIGNDLNARGIKTAAGKCWGRTSFQRMLSNERYMGVYIYAGLRTENGIPPIVRKELFYALQEKLKSKKNPRGRHSDNGDYLLTGKLFCGHCGAFMVGMSGTSKTAAKHYYYDCQTKRQKKECNKKAVRRDWIERKVAEAIKVNIMQDEVIHWLADGYDQFLKQHRKDSLLLTYEDEMNDVNKAIKNVMTAIEQGIITPTTKERLVELEDERRRLEALIAIERAALVDIPKERIEFWLHSFREGDVDDKKYQAKLISSFVQAVYLYDHDLRIVCNYTGKGDSITVTFDEVDSVDKGFSPESSYKVPAGSPNDRYTKDVRVPQRVRPHSRYRRLLGRNALTAETQTCAEIRTRGIPLNYPMLLPPSTHLVKNGDKGLSALCQTVFHLRRYLRIFLPMDQTVGLQFFQRRTKRFIRNTANILFHLIEADNAKAHQGIEDKHFIFPLNERHRVTESGFFQSGVLDTFNIHAATHSL